MPGEVLERGAPRGHHYHLPNTPPPAPRRTHSPAACGCHDPWQVLYANTSTYKQDPGGLLHQYVALRWAMPREVGGGDLGRGEAARAARNDDRQDGGA